MCSDLVEISFQDQTGRWISEKGLVEDVSAAGLCVSLSIPISVGRAARISAEDFLGEAEVRHCNLCEYSYIIGLEFADGYQWDRHKWRPKHLLFLPDSAE